MKQYQTNASTNRNIAILISAVLIVCVLFLSFLSISYQSDNASLESVIESKKRPTYGLFRNLLRQTPRLVISGDHLATAGDTLTFSVFHDDSGFSEGVEPCTAMVFRDGMELLTIPCTLIESEVLSKGIGLQHYSFEYSPMSAGLYEIWVQVGTNRISLSPTIEDRPDSLLILGIPIHRSDIRISLDRIPGDGSQAPPPFTDPTPSYGLTPIKFLLEVVAP